MPTPAPTEEFFESKVLGERRRFLVRLPASYAASPDRRYPVVYVLDGSSQDGHTAATARALAEQAKMPELIVIGIPNVSGGRPRDYTPPYIRQDTESGSSPMGQADRFLAFLKREFIPLTESRYRIAPSDRMLAGHSRGGMFVIYALIEDPALFRAYFAHSPTLHREENLPIRKFSEFLASKPNLAGRDLFVSLGTRENEGLTQAFTAFDALLKSRASASGLRWRSFLTPDAEHANNAQKATPTAFEWRHAGK